MDLEFFFLGDFFFTFYQGTFNHHLEEYFFDFFPRHHGHANPNTSFPQTKNRGWKSKLFQAQVGPFLQQPSTAFGLYHATGSKKEHCPVRFLVQYSWRGSRKSEIPDFYLFQDGCMLNFIINTVNLYTSMQIHVQCTVISTYIYSLYMCTKYLEPVCPLIWNFRTPKEGPDGCILKVRKPPVTPKKWIHMVKKYFQQENQLVPLGFPFLLGMHILYIHIYHICNVP